MMHDISLWVRSLRMRRCTERGALRGLLPRPCEADFVCEAGWMVPEQQWEGVPVAAMLGRTGVDPAACFLKVYAGNFTVRLPLQEALTGGAIMARTPNGAPLTPEHGAPLLLVAPGRACFYSVKWVDRLEVVAEEAPPTGEAIARARLARGADDPPSR